MVNFKKRAVGSRRRRKAGKLKPRIKTGKWKMKGRINSKLVQVVRRVVVALVVGGLGFMLVGWWWVGHQGGWNGVNNINVLVVGSENREVELVSYAPTKRQLSLLWLGGEVEVPTVWGYGQYRLGVLRDLGIQEGLGLKLLEKSVSDWLGIPITGTVVVRKLEQEKLGSWNSMKWQLLRSTRGDLGIADKVKLFRATADIYQSQVTSDDLMVGSWYKSEFNPAGDRVVRPVAERINKLTRMYLQDEQVVGVAGREVAVVNATSHEGLATRAATSLQSMGYDVVNITNGKEMKQQSELRVAPEVMEQKYYLEPMEKVFGIEPMVLAEVETKYRADVVLLVGEDYYQLWYGNGE